MRQFDAHVIKSHLNFSGAALVLLCFGFAVLCLVLLGVVASLGWSRAPTQFSATIWLVATLLEREPISKNSSCARPRSFWKQFVVARPLWRTAFKRSHDLAVKSFG